MLYKNWRIEKADYGYYEATSTVDCDAELKLAKSIKEIKEEIDEDVDCEVEGLLLDVYDKGLKQEDCNLTDYYDKIKEVITRK